jgi:nitroreductase
MNELLNALNFRHACKNFDENRIIEKSDFDELLEIIRLSPSSFGMEPWRIKVIRDKNLRAKLRELCWNQPQITQCSELVVFTVDTKSLKPDTEYVKNMFLRRGLSNEATATYIGVYTNYLSPIVNDEKLFENWCAKQCYIAAANLMSAAAIKQIDSCPIEGFEKESVEKLLELKNGDKLALMVALGFRVNEQSQRARLSLDQIVEFK